MTNEKIYTATDFASYHAGTMPAQDMHALEKAALEDPFLADALDGYALAKTPVDDVETIKGKLNAVEDKPQLFAATTNNKNWMRVAASIAIVFGLGYLFYTVNKKDDEQASLADNKVKQEVKTDTITTETKNAEVATNSEAVAPKPLINDLKTPQTQANITPSGTVTYLSDSITSNFESPDKSIAQNGITQQAPVAIAPGQYKAEEVTNISVETVASKRRDAATDDDAIKDRTADLAQNNRMQNNVLNYYNYSGVVQKPSGGPMQNATIRLRNSNTVTQTDKFGRFNFKATDTIASVSIAALGYDKKEVVLNTNAVATLKLDNKNANLDEVVVAGYSTKKKSANVGFSNTDAEKALQGKVSGMKVQSQDDKYNPFNKVKGVQIDSSKFSLESKSFYNYVKENIKPEFDELGNEYKGNVVLSFTVNKKGDPRKIKVVQSLSDKCNNQAVELLEKGPRWFFPKGDVRTVVIEF
jgi:CarboxypepD_reg-like domain/Gram-negative bacterial TonB protein C-terminal